MTNDLEEFGIRILEPMLVEEFYEKMRAIFVHDLSKPDSRGMLLDLNALPAKPPGLKEAVIKWLISVNLTRIRNGDDPIITLQLVLRCPVWRIISPPLRRVQLTKEQLFNKPGVKTIGQKQIPGSINKKR